MHCHCDAVQVVLANCPSKGFQQVDPLGLLQFDPVPQKKLVIFVVPSPAHEPVPVNIFV